MGMNAVIFFGWMNIILLLILIGLDSGLIWWMSSNKMKSSFTNDPNNIRQYVQVGDDSQNERQARAVAQARVSGMTGSRDIPVFFQDYDYDMTLSKTGLTNSREGLDNPDVNKKLKNMRG